MIDVVHRTGMKPNEVIQVIFVTGPEKMVQVGTNYTSS